MKNHTSPFAQLFLRMSLGVTFLSAVADRCGFWGIAGSPGVAWGNWENFIKYSQTLNFFVSKDIGSILGLLATILEIIFGILLIIGFKIRWVAMGTGILTLLFALSMTLAYSIKAPLDYSVIIDSAAAFLLASFNYNKFSIDSLLEKSEN